VAAPPPGGGADQAGQSGAAEPSFALDYDGWSLSAAPARGDAICTGFGSPDLQLRMFAGIKGAGGSLKFANAEYCQYALRGNLDPQQGTISLWVSPQNWKASDDRFQIFFTAKDRGWRMIVYKYFQYSRVNFYLETRAADGSLKRHNTYVTIDDEAWRPGVWRKLDALWDLRRGMRLLVDGAPGVGESELEFKAPVVLPPITPDARIVIGGDPEWRANPHFSQQDETAVDQVRIYDRMLPQATLRDDYVRFFPSAIATAPGSNVATVPRAGGVTVDGRIDEAEWAGAARLPLLAMRRDVPNPPRQVRSWAWLSTTADAMQIAVRSNAKGPYRSAVAKRDGPVWEDESFELFLVSPADGGAAPIKHHLIVNPSGTLFDERDGDRSWDSGTTVAASQDADGWSAELSIPLAALKSGGSVIGESWRANLYATRYPRSAGAVPLFTGWSMPSASYHDMANYGTLLFSDRAIAVRIDEIGDPSGGTLALTANVVPAGQAKEIAVSAGYEVDGAAGAVYPGNVAGTTWRTTLPGGRQKLTVDARAGGAAAPLFHYEHDYYVRQPLEIAYSCFPGRGAIEVRYDAAGAGEAMAKAIAAGRLRGTAALVALREGRRLAESAFIPAKVHGMVALPMPPDLATGDYEITVRLESPDSEAIARTERLRVPDLAIYRDPPVTDHLVPPPWTPVRRSADGTFALWGRVYAYGGGPFPVAITANGAEVLSAPVTLQVDLGAGPGPVRWTDGVVVEAHEDAVTMAGSGSTGSDGRLRVDWRTTLHFDGISRTSFTLVPAGPATVNAMRLRYGLAPECGRFALTPLLERWQGDRLDLAFAPVPNAMKDFSLWLTGHDRGLFWWPESNANWVPAQGEQAGGQVQVVRGPGGVEVGIAMIGRPTAVTAPASYTCVFMASPARPTPPRARTAHEGGWGKPKGQGLQTISWGSFIDRVQDDDCTDFFSHRPMDGARYSASVESWRAKGIAPLPYSQPTYIGSLEPEYDLFGKTWEQFPARTFDGSKAGVRYKAFPCCPNSQFSDYIVQRAVTLMDGQPRIGGVYYDLCWASYCENHEHGCGGTDSFGRRVLTSSAWGLRSALMRIYKAAHRRGMVVMNHNHSLFNPVAHNFTDIWYPGEQYETSIAHGTDPEWFYCEGIPADVYQSELSMGIKGVGICFLPQFARAAEMTPSLRARADFTSEEFTIRTITPLVLHDIPVSASWMHPAPVAALWELGSRTGIDEARFTGYWANTAVAAADPSLRVSYYTWAKPGPYRALIVVGNLGRTQVPVALAIDRAALGLGGAPLQIEDALSRRGLEADGGRVAAGELPGNHHRMLGVRLVIARTVRPARRRGDPRRRGGAVLPREPSWPPSAYPHPPTDWRPSRPPSLPTTPTPARSGAMWRSSS
jgi:hypothetical protein